MEFIQKCETNQARLIIMYSPLPNIFWPNLHPKASLYLTNANMHTLREEILGAKKIFEKNGIEVLLVNDILKSNRERLLKFAVKTVTYKLKGELLYDSEEKKRELEYYLSDMYKEETFKNFTDDELLEVIVNKPTCYIEPSKINTGLILSKVEIEPLGNLIYCRDQQIITSKGIIITNLNSKQRKRENEIIKLFYEQLEIKILGEILGEQRLEGGDFMIIKEDLSLMGTGIRTNVQSGYYLMANDFLGTKRFGFVLDEFDLDQDRMHLDTIFNILNPEEVILLEMSTVKPKKYDCSGNELDIRRKIALYERFDEKKTYGNYEFVKIMDFETFLIEEGYRVIKVTHEQQCDYMINFLNIGGYNIISPNKDMDEFLKQNNSKSIVQYVEFGEILKMYGAVHCATQVVRI